MSSGEVIGIVIAVIVVLAAASLALGYVYIQRIKRRQHAQGGPIDPATLQSDEAAVKYDSSGAAVSSENCH